MDVRSQNRCEDGKIGWNPGTKGYSTRLQSMSKIKGRRSFTREHARIHSVCYMQNNRGITTSGGIAKPRSISYEKVRDVGINGSAKRISVCICEVIGTVDNVGD